MLPNVFLIVLATVPPTEECVPSWPVPVVRALHEEFRRAPTMYTETIRESHGYYLGTFTPTVFPSGEWIVADLNEFRARWPAGGSIIPGPDTDPAKIPRPETKFVAVLAINPRSGKTLQLTLPAARHRSGYSFGIGAFFPLGSDSCGVELWRERDVPAKKYSVWNRARLLWEWHLDTNTLNRVGDWVPLHRLFSVLDLRNVSVCWRRPNVTNGNIEVSVRDTRTRNLTHVSLDTTNLYADPHFPDLEQAQWFAPVKDGRGFVICDSSDTDHSKQQISCVDPRVQSGRRWVISQNDLQQLIGTSPDRVAIIPHFPGRTTWLPVIVHGYLPVTEESTYRVVLIDTETGIVVRAFKLDVTYWPTSPVVSPDSRLLVYVEGSGAKHVFKLISLDDGRELGEFDALRKYGYVYPFAFKSDSTFLAADENTIWSFDVNAGWNAQQLFQLAENCEMN